MLKFLLIVDMIIVYIINVTRSFKKYFCLSKFTDEIKWLIQLLQDEIVEC
jgi:hypothetical protein